MKTTEAGVQANWAPKLACILQHMQMMSKNRCFFNFSFIASNSNDASNAFNADMNELRAGNVRGIEFAKFT